MKKQLYNISGKYILAYSLQDALIKAREKALASSASA